MSRFVKLRFSDYRQLLLHPGIQKFVDETGEKIAEACGPGYEYRPPTRNEHRDRGIVLPVTIEAKRSNAKHYTLVRETIREATSE